MLYCDKISVVVNVRTIFNSSFPSRAVDYKLGSIKVRSVEGGRRHFHFSVCVCADLTTIYTSKYNVRIETRNENGLVVFYIKEKKK